jgi:nucleotide-binding universal stress UspA family protein
MESASHTILVATDGSRFARSASSMAIQIAKNRGRTIRGLYVVDEALVLDMYKNFRVELGRDDEPSSRAELIGWFEEQGAAELAWLEERCHAESVSVDTEIVFGGVPELVRTEAEAATLLAIGRRGRRHASDRSHLGEYFQGIAHGSLTPLLVGGEAEPTLQHILLAYDGTEHARRALNWVIGMRSTLPVQADVLAVAENPGKAREWFAQMQDELEQSGLSDYRLITDEGNPAPAIVAAADENDVDLIVMGGYHHTKLFGWLVGSTLDRVLRDTSLPVLVAEP